MLDLVMLVKSDREKGEIAASVPPCPYLELHPERGRVRSAAAAKSLQSCPTLCDPIDGSPPGSSVHRIH